MHGIAATKSPGGFWITKSFNTRPQWEIKQNKKGRKKARHLKHIQTPLKTEFLFSLSTEVALAKSLKFHHPQKRRMQHLHNKDWPAS